MLWIDDRASYHIFKSTTKWKHQAGLICIDWLAQLPNFNFIKNL